MPRQWFSESKIRLFPSISCYSWLITFNFKVHQDAHFQINFYFIDFLVIGQIILRHVVSKQVTQNCKWYFHAYSDIMPYIFATYCPFTWKRTVPLINFTSYEPVQPMQEMELLEKRKRKAKARWLKGEQRWEMPVNSSLEEISIKNQRKTLFRQ